MTNGLRMISALLLALSGFFSSGQVQAGFLAVEDPQAGIDLRVWANDGGEKIPREQLRAFNEPGDSTTLNSVWDGAAVSLFAARNEVVSVALVIDNNGVGVNDVSVTFDSLQSANGSHLLATTNSDPALLFDWRNRPIEVFVVEYLKIHGLSFISYPTYDETHIPFHLQRPVPVDLHPVGGPNVGEGGWADRPYHDLSYPDIAIPQEVQAINGGVSIASQTSQIFWIDIYVPRDTPAEILSGTITINLAGEPALSVPVSLDVYDFSLPDERHAKSMVYIEALDIKKRYFTGTNTPLAVADQQAFRDVMNRHYRLAWRHGISLFDANELLPDTIPPIDQPNIDWENRLTENFYSAENGYAGPGADQPHDLFVIGSYGAWAYWWGLRQFNPTSPDFDPEADESLLQSVLEDKTGLWESWFQTNSPDTRRFLYVDDEPTVTLEFAERVAGYVENSPTAGSEIGTFITASPLDHADDLPSPSIFASLIDVAPTAEWEIARAARPDRTYYMYNGRRPASGSFATDDDGVALRSLVWGQYKKQVGRWFYWHSTYYNNIQGGAPARIMSQVAGGDGESYRRGSETNVFKSAHTFGGHDRYEEPFGERGFNYGNGDGLLFYPGTDLVFPEENLGLNGPIASLRLKHWRRGIQDAQYLHLASEFQPAQVDDIVQAMIPEALWEIGVQVPEEPTYVHKAPSWSIDPDDWEAARRQLAEIIAAGLLPSAPQITTQPLSVTAFEGEAVQLMVVASGNPVPAYQWFKNGQEIAGEVFAAVTLQSLSVADAASYTVIATNSVGSVTSEPAVLEVLPALAAPVIVQQPQPLAVSEGTFVAFSVTATGNPEPGYQWLKDGNIIPDANFANYSIAAVTLGAAGDYSVQVSNSAGTVTSELVELSVSPVADAPAILVPPLDAYVMAGEPVTFTVAVSGTPEPDLQWLRDGVPIAGETSSTLLLSGVRDNAGFYSVIASNSAGSVESPAAELVVGLAEADVSFIVRDAASLNTNEASMHDALLELGHTVVLVSDSSDLPAKTAGTDLIVISGLARAAFLEDLFAEERRPIWLSQSLVFESMNLVVPGTSVTRSSNQQSINLLDTLGASAGALALGELRVVDRDKQFMTGQPVAAARVVATLADGTDRPAIFSLKRGDELADGSVAAGKRMAWFSNGYTARRWTSEGRLLFKQSIAWLLDSVQERAFAPVFISDPQSQSAAPGSAVSFSATATAAPAPSYQWLRNGLPVAGAIDSTLLVLAAPDNVGSYQLIATNSEGVAASALANLTLELDVTPPMLVGVSVLADNALEVEFSEAVAESHAEIAANYVIDQGVTVITATVSRPGVVVLTTSELPAATSFVLIVNNVEDASGNSLAPDSQVVFTRPQETISVALVVGSLSLSSTDEGWRDKLQSLGYLVEVVLDRRADSVTTAAQDIVIISGSARTARVADGFVADSRPVLVSEVFLYPTMGLTGAGNGSGFGFEQRQTEIELVASSSLPGTTNGPGALTITERNRSLNWGVPGADADLFATVVGEPLRATVFAYAAGATLANGELASGKRIAWHDSGTSALRWTPGGEVLFEQAIRWLLQN